MKRMIYSLLFSGATVCAMAAPRNSDLHVSAFNHEPIQAYLNGRLVSVQAQETICINDIPPGRHHLQVVVPRHHGFGHQRPTVFDGSVFVEACKEIHAEIDRYGRFRVRQVLEKHIDRVEPVHYNEYNGRSGYCGTPTFGLGAGGYHNDAIINNREFQSIKRMLENSSFENTRLKLAKRAINGRWITSRQLRQMLELFWFENSRVEFAKYAYTSVSDKNRFYIIYDAFDFNSSIDKIERFLAHR